MANGGGGGGGGGGSATGGGGWGANANAFPPPPKAMAAAQRMTAPKMTADNFPTMMSGGKKKSVGGDWNKGFGAAAKVEVEEEKPAVSAQHVNQLELLKGTLGKKRYKMFKVSEQSVRALGRKVRNSVRNYFSMANSTTIN